MKYLLILSLLVVSTLGFSQELNFGGTLGMSTAENKMTLGGSVEYRPNKSMFSINTDSFLLINDSKAIVTLPLYLKLIIGNSIKLCPNLGAFLRTNSNYGWTTGLSIEYNLSEKLVVLAKGDYMTDFYKSTYPDHFGGSYESLTSDTSLLFSIGIKKNIF